MVHRCTKFQQNDIIDSTNFFGPFSGTIL